MHVEANLDDDMWPETWTAATYLYNRSPQLRENWKTPFQRLHEWLRDNNRDTGYSANPLPDITHLKAYGCKAYPLTTTALQGTQKRDLKTQPHAEIGYLVGYDSHNIYRIWIPSRSEVRRVRDVTFDESQVYQKSAGDIPLVTKEPEILFPEHIDSESEDEEPNDQMVSQSAPEKRVRFQDEVAQLLSPKETPEPLDTIFVAGPEDPPPNSEPEPDQLQTCTRKSKTPQEPIRRSARIQAREKSHPSASFHSAFRAAREERLHKRSLPPEPRSWRELDSHPFGDQFILAGKTEVDALFSRGTFKPVRRDQIDPTAGRPLPLTWAFKYKFNKHGYLTKFKSRLCVRGDLQETDSRDTYAATLAARNFRIMMALMCKFDLESRHLDAVNAFVNAELDELVYVEFPDGFKRFGWVLKLLRALYGLRRSPLLWQKELTATFEELGLKTCSDEPCIQVNDWCIIFFFVDDISILYRKKNEDNVNHLITQLQSHYELTDQGEVSWFLGIRVIRDRDARKVWLCQDSYIDKIATQPLLKA
ncbi:reverse transcriptase (RNA-dependent DNA polymerase) [Hirsutella rhossiliensis]